MGNKEIRYIDPPEREPEPDIPIGLRLRLVVALLQEAFLHPNTTSKIGFNLDENKVIVERYRKKPIGTDGQVTKEDVK